MFNSTEDKRLKLMVETEERILEAEPKHEENMMRIMFTMMNQPGPVNGEHFCEIQPLNNTFSQIREINHMSNRMSDLRWCHQSIIFAMVGFPNVIGCVDCTHVKIISPAINEHEFINRKIFHSINVQLICNANLYIMNADVKWPGIVPQSRSTKNMSAHGERAINTTNVS